jgi:hypothetical protein
MWISRSEERQIGQKVVDNVVDSVDKSGDNFGEVVNN